MEPDRLAVFRAVARQGGFSKAARVLHRTQPAVSQSIRVLEEELGERLFLRRGRQTLLTQPGRVLLESVDEAFAALARGRARLAALRDLLEGELSIGSSDTTACHLLPPVLAAFRRRHPGVELRISNRPSPVTVRQVLERELDLGFVTLPVREPGLAVEKLQRREDVAIVAASHPLAKRRRVSLANLLEHPLLLLDRGSSTRSFLDERIRACGREPRVAMELASIDVIKELVRLDFGVSIVPRVAVETEIAAGALVAHRVLPRSAWRMLGAIHAEPGPLAPAAEVFLELAREMLPAAPLASRQPARSR